MVGQDATAVVAAAGTAVGVGDAAACFAAGADIWNAAGGGVEGDLVVRVQVDTFVYVWREC